MTSSFRPPQKVIDQVKKGLRLVSEESMEEQIANSGIEALENMDLLSSGRQIPLTSILKINTELKKRQSNKREDKSLEEAIWLLLGGSESIEWIGKVLSVANDARVVKVSEELGLVMGYAIICTHKGEDYYDLQGDHIPEDAMLKSSFEFMRDLRTAGEMHDGTEAGTVVFAWPMTAEIAKSFGIKTDTTGLMIAMRPHDDAMLEKFKSGEYTGFSIGGIRVKDEEIEE